MLRFSPLGFRPNAWMKLPTTPTTWLNMQCLKAYEESLSEDEEPEREEPLVLMVRGLFSKLQYPYTQFPCHSLHGNELFDIFWEAVERLERDGLKVLGCTCDGLSVNCSFFMTHGTEKLMYKVENPY